MSSSAGLTSAWRAPIAQDVARYVEIIIDRIQTESALAHLVVSAIPDLSELITNIVREKLFEDLTLPHLDDFPVLSTLRLTVTLYLLENDCN